MKLTKIRIVNMHNVKDKTYELPSNFTYFKGPNGAGKSTVLEAIQLVILGYIPGYSKKNEAIMRHSSDNIMQITGTFDDGSSVIRTWKRNGSSVSSASTTIPMGVPVDSTLGSTFTGSLLDDENMELPIYNFAEFKDMTANKLKDWFISFLPSANDSIDWHIALTGVVANEGRTAILRNDLEDEVLNKIKELSTEYNGIELVRNLNTYLKSEQSFCKKEIERLQGTVQSLIYYDEELSSEEDLQTSLDVHMNLLKKRIAYDTSIAQYNAVKQQLDALNCAPVNNIEEVEGYIELRNQDSNTRTAFKEVSQAKDRFLHQLNSIENQITDLAKLKGSICPYTSKSCKEIEAILEENKKKIEDLKKQAKDLEDLIDAKKQLQNDLDRKMFDSTSELQAIETKYATYFRLRDTLAVMKVEDAPDKTQEELNEIIKHCQESLSKVQANKRYNELIETITADKFKYTNDLEILKIWSKFTDANGLQTQMMTEPFENLAEEMSSYLTKMYNKPTEAHFHLSNKANSFSFGLIRDESYIEFDYLSSGERCLFMLAMMICLLDKSNTSFRTILIDDLIDHLDDNNAKNVYGALHNIKDVQFILAGVKECDVEGVQFV